MENFRGIGQAWVYEFPIKEALYPADDPNEVTEEMVRVACIEVHKRMMSFVAAPHTFTRPDTGDYRMPTYASSPLRVIAQRFKRLGESDNPDVNYFNHDMDLFYDWADANRVLCK